MKELYVYSTMMSPEYRGIFQLMKKETQLAIAREDRNTDGSLVIQKFCCLFYPQQLGDSV